MSIGSWALTPSANTAMALVNKPQIIAAANTSLRIIVITP
jgi:hypothetical protein